MVVCQEEPCRKIILCAKLMVGVIVDIWPTAGRGPSTALFTASVFLGSAIGPVFGSLYVK